MKKPIYYIMIWAYGFLSILDVMLTQFGINNGFSEGNYLSKIMLGKWNIFGLYAIHFIEIFFVVLFNNHLFKKVMNNKIKLFHYAIMMSILNMMKLMVVVWNITLIFGGF